LEQTNFQDRNWLPKNYKPFSKDNFDKYKHLEKVVIDKIKIDNCILEKNSDEYGIDLVIINNNKIVGGLEVESHAKYWTYSFPFNTVHCLGRKKKYTADKNFYLLLSAEARNCILVSFDKMQDKYLLNQTNCSCKDEPIYDIPNNECIFGWNEINIFLNELFNKKVDSWL
jgi:hypothetical protein